jgi:hypothetical protein
MHKSTNISSGNHNKSIYFFPYDIRKTYSLSSSKAAFSGAMGPYAQNHAHSQQQCYLPAKQHNA